MRLKIEKLVYGGEGLARENSQPIFVPFVLAGEEVEAEPQERKKQFVRARLTQIVTPSHERIAPLCPHFGDCGGCSYQHIAYEQQLKFKEQILRETLMRLGHIEWSDEIKLHASPPWEYRNRAQWKIRPPGRNRQSSSRDVSDLGLGYFRARSSELCDVHTCPILSPKLQQTLAAFRDLVAEGILPRGVQEIEAFADDRDASLLLNISGKTAPRALPNLARRIREKLPEAESILLDDRAGERMELDGPGSISYRVLDRTLRVGHLSFFQVNRFLVPEMAQTVAALAGEGALAWDLYAGVGLFATFLAPQFARVDAIEADPASARDLEVNSASSGNISAHGKSAEGFLTRSPHNVREHGPDTIVLDPPRAGLAKQIPAALLAIRPRRIVYVSCDPATLARDLAIFLGREYHLRELHLFDMFPQTYHIETLALLEAK